MLSTIDFPRAPGAHDDAPSCCDAAYDDAPSHSRSLLRSRSRSRNDSSCAPHDDVDCASLRLRSWPPNSVSAVPVDAVRKRVWRMGEYCACIAGSAVGRGGVVLSVVSSARRVDVLRTSESSGDDELCRADGGCCIFALCEAYH